MLAPKESTSRPVFVTGATSGIGLETARLLAAEGFRVLGGALPGEDHAPLQAAGGSPVPLDVTDGASISAARGEIATLLQGEPLWALVNCAGVVAAGPLETVRMEEFKRVFDVNLFGVLAVTQSFLPQIRQARGRIVNLSSLSGLLAVPFLGPYNTSKFAIEALSDCLRRELHPLGVSIVVIQPGVTRTPMWQRASEIDASSVRGTPYEKAAERVQEKAIRKGGRGQPPIAVARAILRALTEPRPPTRIRVQKRRKAWLRYAILPLLPDRLVDRLVAEKVWSA
jgi:NAD(P)-dependent dehydrogenase (short-subunit alcohol dehydrogenase family)